jgi:hypothetical protein
VLFGSDDRPSRFDQSNAFIIQQPMQICYH